MNTSVSEVLAGVHDPQWCCWRIQHEGSVWALRLPLRIDFLYASLITHCSLKCCNAKSPQSLVWGVQCRQFWSSYFQFSQIRDRTYPGYPDHVLYAYERYVSFILAYVNDLFGGICRGLLKANTKIAPDSCNVYVDKIDATKSCILKIWWGCSAPGHFGFRFLSSGEHNSQRFPVIRN